MKFEGVIRHPEKKDLSDIQSIYSLYYSTLEDIKHFVNRVRQSINRESEALDLDLQYLIAEIDDKVVGFIGFRKPPQKMISFTKTSNPVELYTLFVNDKQNGTGRVLLEKMIEVAGQSGYTEIVVYSSDRWKDGWPFYDKMGFERVGILTHAGGSSGQVWRKDLKLNSF